MGEDGWNAFDKAQCMPKRSADTFSSYVAHILLCQKWHVCCTAKIHIMHLTSVRPMIGSGGAMGKSDQGLPSSASAAAVEKLRQ